MTALATRISTAFGCWLLALVIPIGMPSLDAQTVDFNRDIRPILSNHCFVCHGPDEESREAELRLDRSEDGADWLGALAVLEPGDREASEFWHRIASEERGYQMPPVETDKPLSEEQIELVGRWIDEGATFARHWAFESVVRPLVPNETTHWESSHPIDRFLNARLESEAITSSPIADRRMLARRLSLDLIGLPPSPALLLRFISDQRPDAWERYIDQLLAHPGFGERWGRHWLDQARYADSHGYTNDGARVMWPYRDWVIHAFNDDMGFDQFTIEQLAGDLLSNPTISQRVATGFHRNTLINNEGGTKADQFRVEQVKDRVDTTGLVWMGLTVGCAQCHTHKFDPITHREYYELYAFLNSTADVNSVSPTLQVPTAKQHQELEQLAGQHQLASQQLAELRSDLEGEWQQWLEEIVESIPEPVTWESTELEASSENGAVFESLDDRSLLATGANVAGDRYRVALNTEQREVRAIRLRLIKHDSLPQGGPGRAGNGNFVLSDILIRDQEGQIIRFADAFADHSQPNFDVRGAIDEDARSGWAINGSPEGGPNHNRVATFILAAPLASGLDDPIQLELVFDNGESPYNFGRFAIDTTAQVPTESTVAQLAEIAKTEEGERTREQTNLLEEAFRAQHPELLAQYRETKRLESQLSDLRKTVPSTMVLQELDRPREAFVQVRGDFLRPGEPVTPGVPQALPEIVSPSDAQLTRLDLAKWLVEPQHPLTARVRVNRIWMRLFGFGLVETENDFGIQGQLPSHPELLDFLADEFVKRQWSTKDLIRLIVTSDAYQRTSTVTHESQLLDPRNRLLSRQNRFRVEAEIVRDQALAVSDLLRQEIGGASVYPPQPDGVYAFTQVRKNWPTSSGGQRFRRGMYTFFYRSSPHPLFSTFDVPRFNQTCTRRNRSNTPLQSLTIANDPAMIELAVGFAVRILDESSSGGQAWEATAAYANFDRDTARLHRAFLIAMSRAPSSREIQRLSEYLHFLRGQASIDESARLLFDSIHDGIIPASWPEDELVELYAWTNVCRLIINLDEFITRE